MITLQKVTVNKYKSIQNPQTVDIDQRITVIVGKNESGKTSFLSALAKTNYFQNDDDFKFDVTHDYPRNELIDFEDTEEDCKVVECHYLISEELLKELEEELGKEVFEVKEFSLSYYYRDSPTTWTGIVSNQAKFLEQKAEQYTLSEATKDSIVACQDLKAIAAIQSADGDDGLEDFKEYIKDEIIDGSYASTGWSVLSSYIAKSVLNPRLPKFWYFDDYYPLPGKININEIDVKKVLDEKDKTSRALFEFARIKPKEILKASSNEYEKFIALLEASSNKITKEIFKYWSTNQNLDIDFKIQSQKDEDGGEQKILDIRVKSGRHKVSLPLDRRSKGFNWFFSFIVWFSKVQADKSTDYILLLDEPGLNLHASAQADLLRFISDLSTKYQIIYTTHSPFMVDSDHLNRVRTCLETENGTVISETIQEKDPDTLFPLQAALGYNIAQNLFISKNNLLVEGPADLIYLTVLSNVLEGEKRTSLKDGITIVPVGGLDKISTFIALLKGQELNLACLLDTFTDPRGKQKVEDLIHHKIIKEKQIRFFDEFASSPKKAADIEDVFTPDDYLKVFNQAFYGEYPDLLGASLDSTDDPIVKKINRAIGKDRFNHYRPANKLNQLGVDKSFFDPRTLDNFEQLFNEINKLFN